MQALQPYIPHLIVGLGVLFLIALVVLVFLFLRQKEEKEFLTKALVQFQSSQEKTFLLHADSLRKDFLTVSSQLKTSQDIQFSNFMQMMQNESTEQITTAKGLQDSLLKRLDVIDTTVKEQLNQIQTANSKAIGDMRQTVEEKLQETLNARITASFKTVEEQLSAVYKGLGEMRHMAQDVDGLRRVLTNVKSRGTFGEMQLELILTELLTPDQYVKNVATRPNSSERVEFAIRLPGQFDDTPVWLPIDAKFPLEDYERLMDAYELGDKVALETAGQAIEKRIYLEAEKIHTKYIEVPYTTEFAVMYLPVESLWAEVLRRPGLIERIHREFHITVAGPSVIAALLNSLQMGFRTLAIEKKSAEVWRLLGMVKGEFLKFNDAIGGVEKKLEAVKTSIESMRTRTNVMGRKLRDVDTVTLPAENVTETLTED